MQSGSNEPLKRARVRLTKENDASAPPLLAVTDVAGKFTIEEIAAGRYDMYVERDGFVGKSYGEDDQGDSSKVITIKPGQPITDLVFYLQRCAAISGSVLDEDGEPIERVNVEILRRSAFKGRETMYVASQGETNDLGQYRLFDVAPGKYYVRALPRGGSGQIIGGVLVDQSILVTQGGYAPSYYPSGTDASRASSIELHSGDDIFGIDIMLARERSYTVRGRIVNSATDRTGGETTIGIVANESESAAPLEGRRGNVDEKSGLFEIKDVAAGSYLAIAEWRDAEDHFEGSASVDVQNADVDSVRIVISRGSDVHGRVRFEGKHRREGNLEIGIESRDPRGMGARRDDSAKADGTFSLVGLPAGLYDFDVWSRCDVCYIKSIFVNGSDVVNTGLQVGSGANLSSIEILYRDDSANIAGTVTKNDGSVAPGATVVLMPDGPRRERSGIYRRVPTDQYGGFVAKGIVPGKYYAFAFDKIDYSSSTDPDFLKRFEDKGQSFTVSEEEKKSLQLTLVHVPAESE